MEQENTLVQDLDVKKTNIEKSSESKTSESLKSHSLALSTGSKLISSKSQKNTLNENSSHISLPFSPIHFSESLKDIQVGISSDDDYVKTEDDELSNNELYLDEETVKILSQGFLLLHLNCDLTCIRNP